MGLCTVAAFCKCVDGTWEDLLALEEEVGGASGDAAVLLKLWRASGSLAAARIRRFANVSSLEVGVAHTIVGRKRTSKATELASHCDVSRTELGASAVSASRPLRKLRRSRLLVGDPKGREKREQAQRIEWLPHLLDSDRVANLPIVAVVAQANGPSSVFAAVGQGRRISTIDRRVLDGHNAARYYMMVGGRPWARGLHDVLDYMQCLAMSGEPRSSIVT